MPFQPVPKVAHVALNGTLHGELIQSNLYFLTPDPEWRVDSLTLLADGVNAWWAANLRQHQGPAYTLRNVVATDLTTEIAPQVTSTIGLPLAGTATGATLPGSLALCISFRTGLTGRSARGRNYFPGLTEDQVNGNAVAAGTVNAVAIAYQQLLAGGIEGFTWVVVQRWSNKVELAAGVPRPILSVTVVDVNVDSQRRRLAGRGA